MRPGFVSARFLTYVKPSSANDTLPLTRRTGRGAKKALDSYLICNGIAYPGPLDVTLGPARQLLGADYALPDDLLLQTVTHKSFAHGLKPYNESLAILGRHFLRLQTIGYAVSQPSQSPSAVNGHNFDVATAKISALMSATPVTAKVGRLAGIDASIFWKSPNESKASDLVVAKSVDAIVGALLMNKGQFVAQKFVKERLLQGKYSLIDIAKQIYV